MFNFDALGIGTDIEEIDRFEKYSTASSPFVLRIFTKDEIEYCFSKKNYASHLAARYCAKEACLKAVCSFGYEAVSYADFEIYHARNGVPEVRILNESLASKVELKISLSHNKTNALCCAIAHKKPFELDYIEGYKESYQNNFSKNKEHEPDELRRDVYGSAEI